MWHPSARSRGLPVFEFFNVVSTFGVKKVSEVEGVVPHRFEEWLEGGRHRLIKWLRDTGELTRILERALSPRPL